MSEAAARATPAPEGHLSRLVDRRQLLHLDRPRRRPPRLAAASRRAPDVRPRCRQRPIRSNREQAFKELLIAEGSDWFWWYGDDHSSDHDLEFDELFRRHLRNVYRMLGQPVPEELFCDQHQHRATCRAVVTPQSGCSTRCSTGERPATSNGCRRASSKPMRRRAR